MDSAETERSTQPPTRPMTDTITTVEAVEQHGITAFRVGPDASDRVERTDRDTDGWSDERPYGESVSYEVNDV